MAGHRHAKYPAGVVFVFIVLELFLVRAELEYALDVDNK